MKATTFMKSKKFLGMYVLVATPREEALILCA